MAAIVPVANIGRFHILRSAATTSQTDWLYSPGGFKFKFAVVRLAVTTAGTSTILTISSADPAFRDDGRILTRFTSATITAASDHEYLCGPVPTVTALADADADDAVVAPDALKDLPTLLGLGVVATGSTYTLSIEYK